MADRSLLERARSDVGVFAEALVAEPLWPHQLVLARSPARVRVACCGRQSGKSRTLAMMALHEAFSGPGRLVLVVSATDDAAKRLLAEVAALASAPLLAGSVVDESKSLLVLSNGSQVVSVPASERQVRGYTADLLVIDEAAFVSEEVWAAARFTTIARGGRIVLASTPYGRRDRFFAGLFFAGVAGSSGVESFQWASDASPMVSREVLDEWRPTMTERQYRAEILAEWVDEAGAYFTAEELDACTAAFEMIRPGHARGQSAVAGVDWGVSHDACALVVVGVLADGGENVELVGEEPVFVVAWAEAAHRFGLNRWAEHVAEVSDPTAGGFDMFQVASEANGVGSGPTETLQSAFAQRGLRRWAARPVWTDLRRKVSAYGVVKLLVEQRRLVLPRFPPLLAQLQALEYETSDAGNVRLAVPERAGHDDLADALMQAMASVRHQGVGPVSGDALGHGEMLTTPGGVKVFERPRLAVAPWAFRAIRGSDPVEAGW